jgi:O-methyltransferase involved in polyketide biosynthesis
MSPNPYDTISPTAKLVAEMRRYSDIPFAEEIAQRIGAAEVVRGLLEGEAPAPELLCWMAPTLEARYKCMVEGIRRSGVQQVLELASGFSFRGDALNQSASLRYLETDLAEMHETRLHLRDALRRDGVLSVQPRVVFAPLNAVEPDGALLARHLLAEEPVAVVHEGLLQYFSLDEKRQVALQIAALLRRHGGVWLTPDFEVRGGVATQHWTHPHFLRVHLAIARTTQRNLRDAAFTSEEEVRRFLSELGLQATPRAQIDGSFTLSSASRVGTTPAQLELLRQDRRLWEIRLK